MIATSQFTISVIKDGVDGATIVENTVEYCIYTSGDVVPGSPLTDSEGNIIYDANGLVLTDGAWSTTMPQASEGDFIWTRSKTVYSDGTFALAYMVSHYGENGEQGATGVSVTNVVPEYRLSNSSEALTGTGTGYTWSTKKPSVQSDQYIWERQRNELSDGSVVYSEATCDVVMSGLVFDVDQNKNAITSKVWETDISSKIDAYDGSSVQTIRDRVTQTEGTIGGINTTIREIQTNKADSTAVTNMQTQVNTISDTVSGHTQSISNLTTRIEGDETILTETKTTAEQTANKFSWIVQDGSSASSVTYTSNALTAMANQINLTGKVTFNSMDSTLQNRITTAEGNASTASEDASNALTKVNNSIQSTTMHYLATSASSGVTTSTSGWRDTPQSISATNRYLWTYQTITKVGGGTYNTDPVISGVWGNTGTSVTVSSTETKYQASSSGTTTPTGTWLSSPPQVEDGKYLWTRVITRFSDNTEATQYSVARQGSQGTSVTITSTSVQYQASSSGTETPTGTWQNSVPSVSQGNYLWTRTIVNYSNSTSTTSYSVSYVSQDGEKGDTGVSVTKVEQLYRTSNSTTAPAAPTTKVTSTSTAANAWTLAMPTYNSSYPYYYTCTQTTYSNGNYTWTTVARSQAIEDANKTANTANTNASNAVTTANTANGKADTAVSTANTANQNASNAVTTANTANTTANTAKDIANAANDKTSVNLGMKVNQSSFSGSTDNGECYIHGYTDGVAANVDGYVYWNGAKRNVSKTMINPNKVLPYNTTVYLVLRLSSADSDTGTLYMVCYDSGWKSAITPTPTATEVWTWNKATDVVLGQFVEPGSEAEIVDAYLYFPPRSASDVIAVSASDIIEAWKGQAVNGVTTIKGGLIETNTITADQLATNAIISKNYEKVEASSVYSDAGTFLDLANGNITSPTFAVDNTNGTAYIDGTISARNLLVGTAAAELSASAGALNSSQGTLVGNALDASGDYLIYDGDSIYIKTSNFSIDPAGNVTMTGEVNAASGSIGGWTISPKNLHYGSSVGSEGSVYLIPEGSMSYHTVGGSPEMSGWVITAGDSFGVTNNGSLYANDANITGTFTITDGGIGGMTIDSDTIYSAKTGMSSNAAKWAFWAGESNGKHGASGTDAVFKVGYTGKLYSTNAEITGKITAQSGTIGGWKIGDDRLYYSTAETPQVGDSNSVFLMPNGTSSNVTIAGVTSRGWVITAGDSFGVTRTGYVYANYGKIGGVTLSGGNIYAYNTTGTSSGSVAFQLLSDGSLSIGVGNQITMNTAGVLSIPALCVTGELTANQIAANAITASKLSVTIGGNNLLRNSHANNTGSSTPWIWSYGPNPPKSGDKLTFQVKGSSLGSSQQIVTFGVTHTISLAYNSTTGTYVGTFTLSVSNSSDTYFRFNPGSTSATCDWVKLEYGDMATPWSPSPDEAAGFDIDATAIHTAGVAASSNADNSIALSSADFTRTINSVSRSGLRFAIGSNFGVTGTGKLYATDAILAGNIKATTGEIGGFTIQPYYISYGTIGQDASTFIGALNYGLSHNNAKATVAGLTTDTWRLTVGSNFGVTGSGMYATGGKIGGFTIGTNSIVGNNISIYSNSTNQCIEMSATNNVRTTYVGTYAISNQNSSGKSVSMGIDDSVGGTGITIAGSYNTDEIMFMGNANSNSGLYNKTKGQWGIRYNPTSGEAMLYGMQYGVRLVSPPTTATDQTSYFEPRTYLNSAADDKVYLGRSGVRWKAVYAVNGTIQTSDERLKTIHRCLGEDHKKLFMELRPIEYSFISDPDEKHFGLGAQTTEAAMKNLGFGTEYNIVEHSVYDEKDKYGRYDTYNMNYTEALMLAIPVVQSHEKEIAELKAKISELEAKLSQLNR